MQLDIFDHSRDVMLRNDLRDALLRGDRAAAAAAIDALAAEFADDPTPADARVLLDALASGEARAFADAAAADAAIEALEGVVVPAARRVLGADDAPRWLAPAWRSLANRAAQLPLRADRPETHAAALYLRAGDWDAAARAVEGIESWPRIPAPLQWMAEARWRAQGLDAAWGLIAELAWLAPARLEAVARRVADPAFDRLRRRFDAAFEGDGADPDLAWFPAWVLCDTPALAPRLGLARPGLNRPPELALRLLLDLLHLERQGRQRDLADRRQRLRALQPSLYAAYLATR
jgi:hypothetical protein